MKNNTFRGEHWEYSVKGSPQVETGSNGLRFGFWLDLTQPISLCSLYCRVTFDSEDMAVLSEVKTEKFTFWYATQFDILL